QDHMEFGVFFNAVPGLQLGERHFLNSVLLAFDDNGAGPDDDHDDLLVRATFVATVPEPATWLMMIVGFGIIASSARRSQRRTNKLA
ncbi:MAG: PEP-CTERM sorting domain-containing protein, partial [Kordiimonadaceae bacterium]|nr:PEP-CTERM sorting domain-containing protein [Kordiimonadaceae bacterium]